MPERPTTARIVARAFTRTQTVWGTLGLATFGLVACLWALDGRPRPDLSASKGPALRAVSDVTITPVNTDTQVPAREWAGIVIHHSGERFDTIESIEARHHASKLASIGYHFVIGNGSGLGDGEVVSTDRWQKQQPGAHTGGVDAGYYNRNTVGICLVGDGERGRFTDAQIDALLKLIARIGQDHGVDPEHVMLHREVANVVSPGRWFPSARLREHLAAGW